MNNTNNSLSPVDAESIQARFALRIAAHLSERAEVVSADIAERLRFGRELALQRGAASRAAAAFQPQLVGRGASAVLGGGWWIKAGSVIPLLALLGGLLLIQRWQTDAQISVAAEVDTDLLADTLPPTAYSDAGFVEFLKTPRE